MNLLLGINSFAFIFLKAFQQKNVMQDKYFWMMPISILMGFSEVFVISTVAANVTMFTGLAIGIGGGFGCMVACWGHNKMSGDREKDSDKPTP